MSDNIDSYNTILRKTDISRFEFNNPMTYPDDYIELTNINKTHFVERGYKKGTLFRKVIDEWSGCTKFEVYRFSGQRPWDALLFLDEGRPFVIKGRQGRPPNEPIYLYTKPGTLERTVISGAGVEILDENELIAELTDTTSRLCCKDPNTGECIPYEHLHRNCITFPTATSDLEKKDCTGKSGTQTVCDNLPNGVLFNEGAGFPFEGTEAYRSVPGAKERLTNLPHGAILQITTGKRSDDNYGNSSVIFYNVYNTYPLNEQRILLFHDDGAPIHITSPISGQGVFTSFIPPVKDYTTPSLDVYYPIKNTNGDKFKFIDINGDVIFDLYSPVFDDTGKGGNESNKTLFEKHRIKILLLIILLLAFIVYKYTSVNKYFKYNKLSFGKNYNPVEALMNA